MPVHNVTASMVNLARAQLQGVDKASITTTIQTQTLILLLETLIDLGTPAAVSTLEDSAKRTIMGHVTAISEAERARDG
jgi:hypothetical protein